MSSTTASGSLAGRVALVTGAASGIGRAAALAYAAAGASVMVADVDVAGGDETVALIGEDGGQAAFLRTDVSQERDVAALVAETLARFGRLDCAFNNAGIEGRKTAYLDFPLDEFDRIFAINTRGVWICMQHEIPAMLRSGGGAIVNNASIAGLRGAADLPAYSASKHAVVGMTRSVAKNQARNNIRVNAVCPGIIDTPMMDRIVAEVFTREAATVMQPIGRMGAPAEVAAAVVWLSSDAASLVTGIAMPVDGGATG
ncbi:MAG: short chain dehydrogenase [Chloroflexi bacterium]|nr:MAG: short chain dehydrogenase [Chloroflexota bacterium]